jgi:hypothetical protein
MIAIDADRAREHESPDAGSGRASSEIGRGRTIDLAKLGKGLGCCFREDMRSRRQVNDGLNLPAAARRERGNVSNDSLTSQTLW